jgi:hypothetical protein
MPQRQHDADLKNTVVDLTNRIIVVKSPTWFSQKSKTMCCQEKEEQMRGVKIWRKRFVWILFCVVLLTLFGSSLGVAAEKQLKAGFVYVGPVGDYGWSHAHDVGRKYAEKQLPWLKTVYIESVAEADSARIIDRFIQEEKCDVVFTTSFGYMDDTIKAGANIQTSTSCTVPASNRPKMWEPILPTSTRPIT